MAMSEANENICHSYGVGVSKHIQLITLKMLLDMFEIDFVGEEVAVFGIDVNVNRLGIRRPTKAIRCRICQRRS